MKKRITSSLVAVVLVAGCSLSTFGSDTGNTSNATYSCPVTGFWGILQGAPMSFNTNNHHGICYKEAGFPLPDCTQGQNPDFARVPSDWLGGSTPQTSPILAMSMGIDVISVQTKNLVPGDELDGVPVGSPIPVAVANLNGGHGWMAFLFSVHGPLTGTEPLAPAVEAAAICGELDRTVFQYVIPGSVLGDEDLVLRALGPVELDLSPIDKIQAMNMQMTFFHAGVVTPPPPNQYFSRPLPNPVGTRIYFTLHPDVITSPPFVGWFESPSQASSATIFESDWNGSNWSHPTVFRTFAQLTLQRSEVIDGLAIDTVGDLEILFSTQAAPIDDQLQYLSGDERRPFVVDLPPTGTGKFGRGAKRMKSRRGIGDFCIADPWAREFGAEVIDDYIVARPFDSTMEGDKKLVVSGFRQSIGGNPILRTCMSMNEPLTMTVAARVKFGMTKYIPDPSTGGGALGPITWFAEGPLSIPFTGKPISADHKIPFPPMKFFGDKAIVAQWWITTGGQVFVGPLCVLRL